MSTPVEEIVESTFVSGEKPGHGRRICIITSATICCNPRVVKEADALSAAGYDVRVVASQHVSWAVEWDHKLMAQRPWKLNSIRWDDKENGNLKIRSGIRQRGFRMLSIMSNSWLIPERAYSRLFDEQLREAIKAPAELFIAHNPQALPVAAAAARHFSVQFAFDSEDFHIGEFPSSAENTKPYQLLAQLEAKYLPDCAYVTSPSEEIGTALTERYNLKNTRTIHNVFPLSERCGLDPETKDRRGPALSLYWYSQIVGLDRGLQDAIRALALLPGPVQLHIRGDLQPDVRRELSKIATQNDVGDCLYFHKPVPPGELLSRASEHDVGLALEQAAQLNRDLTVANKLFLYLLAGLSVAATATKGQLGVMTHCQEAGFCYPPGNYQRLAAGLSELMRNPSLLRQRKEAALKAARERWNWENESQRLVALVGEVLSARRRMN